MYVRLLVERLSLRGVTSFFVVWTGGTIITGPWTWTVVATNYSCR